MCDICVKYTAALLHFEHVTLFLEIIVALFENVPIVNVQISPSDTVDCASLHHSDSSHPATNILMSAIATGAAFMRQMRQVNPH